MRKKFILATISLNRMAGGLEKNIIYLADHLAGLDHDVHLISFDKPGATSFYDIDKRVKWHQLGASTPHQAIGFRQRLALISRIRKVLAGLGAGTTLICFHHGILTRFILASIGAKATIICSERNSLTHYNHIKASKWNLSFMMLFFVSRITVQFASYKKDYPRLIRNKIFTVHNPVFSWDRPPSQKREKIILSAGRHEHQKQFDLLIEACRLVFDKYPDWKLIIAGDGSKKEAAINTVNESKMMNNIELLDPVRDLYPYFEAASFYCQPSLWEGFPNAMAEAMAAGAVPVGFSCTSGVADLVEDGVNGYLCGGGFSPQNLAATLLRAIDDKDNFEEMSLRARNIVQNYSVESWVKAWQKVLAV